MAGPGLSWHDQAVAPVVPASVRLVLCGLVASALSMALYAALSPQQRLRRIRDEAVEARHALDRHEGSFEEARPLMAAMFATSLKQLAVVLLPAVLASLPLRFMSACPYVAHRTGLAARAVRWRMGPVSH